VIPLTRAIPKCIRGALRQCAIQIIDVYFTYFTLSKGHSTYCCRFWQQSRMFLLRQSRSNVASTLLLVWTGLKTATATTLQSMSPTSNTNDRSLTELFFARGRLNTAFLHATTAQTCMKITDSCHTYNVVRLQYVCNTTKYNTIIKSYKVLHSSI